MAACDPGQSDDSGSLEFPFDGAGGKTDVFGRELAGIAAPYEADPNLAKIELTLRADVARRREVAWTVARKVLEPVPLVGLADAADKHEELELPDGEVPLVPRWQTWYGPQDLRRVFRTLYGELSASGRAARVPFDDGDIDDAFIDNASALERSASWPLERYLKHVAQLGECEPGDTPELCAARRQSGFAGAVGGVGRIAYGPAALRNLVTNYGPTLGCLDGLDDLELDATTWDNPCFTTPFPIDAAVVKAQWARADFGRTVPAFDTRTDALPDAWSEAGDRKLDPTQDEIYTIRLRNGATYRLTGLHVMTKELEHWVWVSLWWSDEPDADFGADRPTAFTDALPDVWRNYKMCTVVFYDEADPAATLAEHGSQAGAPTWCSNPYLEHGPGNARTNCIGCHQHGGSAVELEAVARGDAPFTSNGREQVRSIFPADYLWALTRMDDLGNLMANEAQHFDFLDGAAVKPRVDHVLELDGDPDAGAATFAANCVGCHGPDGGGTSRGPDLGTRVPSRADPGLVQTLLLGKGDMPAWADHLRDQELSDVVAWLRAQFS